MSFPASWARIPVTATYLLRDDSGTPATGRIEFRSAQIVVADGSIIVPVRVTATLDGDGHISLLLPATDDPDVQPNSWTWSVTEVIDRQPRRTYSLSVPHTASSIDLSSISPIPPGSPVYDYLLTSAIGVTVAGQGDLDALDGRVTALEGAGGGVQLSDDTPESLGTASAGVSAEASRSDHVHPIPTAAQVGADISGAASSAITAHEAALDPHPQYTTVSEAGAAAPVQSVAGRTGDITLTTADISGLGTASTANTTDFATAAQGATADNALQPFDGLAALDPAAADRVTGLVGRMDALEAEDLPDRTDALEAGQASGQRVYRLWSELSAITGAAGNGAQVIDDAGTHTDPVVGGTVANKGQYVWSASPVGWRWVREDGLAALGARVSAEEIATVANKSLAETGAYVESFQNNTSVTVTNHTDDGVPTKTITFGPGGMRINLVTASRDIQFSTENVVGGKLCRITLVQEMHTGSITPGVGFAIGAKYFRYTSNGRVSTNGGVDLVTTAPTFAAPVTITTVIDIDDNGHMDATWSHSGGRVSITRTDVAMGDFGLIQYGFTDVTNSAVFESIGPLQLAVVDSASRAELTGADPENIRALSGLLTQLQRAVPSGITNPIPYGFKSFEVVGKYFTNIDLRPLLVEGDPGVTCVYVDPVAGNDANAGTADAPFKSIAKGVGTAANNLIVKAMPGLYDKDTCWQSVEPSASILQVVPWGDGDIECSSHHPALSWTNIGSGTYSATIVDCGSVADASILTGDGDYTTLDLLASSAAVQAQAGSYFVTGTTVYVHLADGRPPDADCRVYRSFGVLGNGRLTAPAQIAYLERVLFHGGSYPLYARLGSAVTAATVLANRCAFNYGSENGYALNGHYLSVAYKCLAAHNRRDGFNYHAYGASDGPDMIEVDCIGRWNGKNAGGTNNGSTMHDPTSIGLRVNGDYHHNQDRNVHDIDGSQTWNLGCKARDSLTNRANWCSGLSSDTHLSKMYLDGCTSSGSAVDLEAPTGKGQLRHANLITGGNNVAGSDIATYTP